MRPDADKVLRGIGMSLAMNVAPQMTTAFGRSTAQLAAYLSLVLASQVDGLANSLLEENRAIEALASAGAKVVADPGLRARLAAAGAGEELPDIRVSTLQAANDRLRGLLIDLHSAVELTPGDAARALEEQIWDELRESTRRRHVDPGF